MVLMICVIKRWLNDNDESVVDASNDSYDRQRDVT